MVRFPMSSYSVMGTKIIVIDETTERYIPEEKKELFVQNWACSRFGADADKTVFIQNLSPSIVEMEGGKDIKGTPQLRIFGSSGSEVLEELSCLEALLCSADQHLSKRIDDNKCQFFTGNKSLGYSKKEIERVKGLPTTYSLTFEQISPIPLDVYDDDAIPILPFPTSDMLRILYKCPVEVEIATEGFDSITGFLVFLDHLHIVFISNCDLSRVGSNLDIDLGNPPVIEDFFQYDTEQSMERTLVRLGRYINDNLCTAFPAGVHIDIIGYDPEGKTFPTRSYDYFTSSESYCSISGFAAAVIVLNAISLVAKGQAVEYLPKGLSLAPDILKRDLPKAKCSDEGVNITATVIRSYKGEGECWL